MANVVWVAHLKSQPPARDALMAEAGEGNIYISPWIGFKFRHPVLERRNMRMLVAGFIFVGVGFYRRRCTWTRACSAFQEAKYRNYCSQSNADLVVQHPFRFFASAAYCEPSTTINFSCGGTSSTFFVWIGGMINRLCFANNSKLRCKPRPHSSSIGR